MLPSDPVTVSLSLPIVLVLGTLAVLGAMSCALTLAEMILDWRDRQSHARLVREWAEQMAKDRDAEDARRRRQQTPVDFNRWN